MSDSRQLQYKDWTCNIVQNKYANDRVALMLVDAEDGSPISTASVNIPEADLADDEIIIKSWSENQGMADVLIKQGIIGPELGSIPTGHVIATVHKLLI